MSNRIRGIWVALAIGASAAGAVTAYSQCSPNYSPRFPVPVNTMFCIPERDGFTHGIVFGGTRFDRVSFPESEIKAVFQSDEESIYVCNDFTFSVRWAPIEKEEVSDGE